MVVWAECHYVVNAVGPTLRERNYMVCFEKKASIIKLETCDATVFALATGSFKNKLTYCCVSRYYCDRAIARNSLSIWWFRQRES